MDMFVCTADDMTFALAYLDAAESAGVLAALTDLRKVAIANVGGGDGVVGPLRVQGMTPSGQAARLRLTGRRPDGGPLHEQAAFFARGLRVYQASVIGRAQADEAADTFFASMKLPS